jgi:glycosyltransferase involved in cell wall biosynthesis
MPVLVSKLTTRFRQADVSFFFDFVPAPYGGGNQFLTALWGEMERRGLRLENNRISKTTRACLYNSFNFDEKRLRGFARAGCRMVHRVDGPLAIYRGSDDGTDRRIQRMNDDLADATVFQSQYSLEKQRELGLTFKNPTVIQNAADPAIFHPGERAAQTGRKVRLISTSWSDNPNKGGSVYKWLEDHLDWSRFEYTFVGRSQIRFDRIRTIPPVPSAALADLLREHDIFITASRHESCSNALIEALSCGLPALYHRSGGSGELAGEGGFGFIEQEELPALLDRLINEYDARRAAIHAPSLADVTDRYLKVMLA